MYRIESEFTWKTIFEDGIKNYLFPNQISSEMKRKYNFPAIYRWNVFKNEAESCKIAYLGETENFIKRIAGFLKPGPSQKTNIRMNTLFTDYISDGFQVTIDVFQIEKLVFNGREYSNADLKDPYLRQMIENALIIEHKVQGYSVLNK